MSLASQRPRALLRVQMRDDAAAELLLSLHSGLCMQGARRYVVPGEAELARWFPRSGAPRRWAPPAERRQLTSRWRFKRRCAELTPAHGCVQAWRPGSWERGRTRRARRAARAWACRRRRRRRCGCVAPLLPLPLVLSDGARRAPWRACTASTAPARRQRSACAAGVLVGGPQRPSPRWWHLEQPGKGSAQFFVVRRCVLRSCPLCLRLLTSRDVL